MITAEPLAAVALGLHMKQSAAKGSLPWGLHAHEGEVTCLLEHSCRLPDTDGVSEAATLLLSGGADGCVHAVHARSGSCHFRLSLHTAEVSLPNICTPMHVIRTATAKHACFCSDNLTAKTESPIVSVQGSRSDNVDSL